MPSRWCPPQAPNAQMQTLLRANGAPDHGLAPPTPACSTLLHPLSSAATQGDPARRLHTVSTRAAASCRWGSCWLQIQYSAYQPEHAVRKLTHASSHQSEQRVGGCKDRSCGICTCIVHICQGSKDSYSFLRSYHTVECELPRPPALLVTRL